MGNKPHQGSKEAVVVDSINLSLSSSTINNSKNSKIIKRKPNNNNNGLVVKKRRSLSRKSFPMSDNYVATNSLNTKSQLELDSLLTLDSQKTTNYNLKA